MKIYILPPAASPDQPVLIKVFNQAIRSHSIRNLTYLQIRGGGHFSQVIVVCAGKRPKISFPELIGNPKINDFTYFSLVITK